VKANPVAATIMRPMPWPDGVELLTPMREGPWRYVLQRGITPAQVRDYKIGVGVKGRLDGYIIFPLYQDGALAYWQGRASWNPPVQMTSEDRKLWVRETNYRKTLNPVSEPGHAVAADVLFNHDRARTSPHLVICEGPVDAIKVGTHAVALLGKAWSGAKLQRLLRMRAQRYTIYLDRGDEERASALSLAAALSSYAPVYLATPPEGLDAGSLTPAQNELVIEQAVLYTSALLVARTVR
jgi:hypothetical protein